jgi:Flp pilus assembly protein TadB
MKELNDNELLNLAYKHLAISDKHMYSTIVLMVVAMIQVFLLIFNLIGVFSFLVIYPICFLFYFYHKSKGEKHLKIVDEALKEFASRGI